MKIIVGYPGSGKTKYVLKQSADRNIPVLCESQARLERLLVKAQGYGFSIPRPIVFDEVTSQTKEVLIDDIERLLSAMLNCKVLEVSINVENEEDIINLDK